MKTKNNKIKEDRNNKIRIIILCLLVLALLILFAYKFTGFAVSSNFVTRSYSLNKAGVAKVTLTIGSVQHLVAIQETFPSDCYIGTNNYTISKKYALVGFKSSENVWILADNKTTMNAKIVYTVLGSCGKPKGNYSFDGINWKSF